MKEYMKMLKNTFNYSGRTRRREYWVPAAINSGIQLFLYGLMFLGATLAGDCLFYKEAGSVGFTTTGSTVATILCVPYILFSVYAFITQLSLTVRRFHDIGKPGWLVAICIIGSCCCGIGAIVQIVFCCFDSKEDNQWGENPKNHNEYESLSSIIAAVSIYIVMLIFVIVAMCTNAFADHFQFLPGKSLEPSTEDFIISEDMTESEDTEEVADTEDMTSSEAENTEDNTEQNGTVNGDNVIIKIDNSMQVEIPVPTGLTVDSQGDSYVYFSGDEVTMSVSSAILSTKEEALDSLKDSYSPFNGLYDNVVESESKEAVETTVMDNPVYYSKTVLDYEDRTNTIYHMYVDLGAEYLLEIDIDTYQAITDEQALSFAKFQKE